MGKSRLNSASLFLLLFLLAAELALYQIAVPATLPPDPAAVPPFWHQLMEYAGLFFFYFASTLALAILLAQMVHQLRRDDLYPRVVRWALAIACGACAAYGLISIASQPTPRVQFLLETTYTFALIVLVVAQFTAGGDLPTKIGVGLLSLPFVIHFYGPFSVQFVEGEQALWAELPEKIQELGQWSLVAAALLSPLCFAPRPWVRAVTRPGPMAVSLFTGLLGLVVLTSNYEVGMRMASAGLGIELAPAEPMNRIAVYLLALVTGMWTLISCLTSPSESRRRIGVGIGLVFAAGYGFVWPVQFLAGLVGLVVIAEGAHDVGDEEEREERTQQNRFRAPPIEGETWQRYVAALVETLRGAGGAVTSTEVDASGSRNAGGSNGGESLRASAVTVRGDDGRTRTHVAASMRETQVQLSIEREGDAIILIQVMCGQEPTWGEEPVWTLHARPEGGAAGSHPGPPRSSAPAHKSGDEQFDQRFRVRDRGGYTDILFDDGMRAQATALLDGWLAYWPGKGLVYRVHPGRGAPLDNPIPISELAFRGSRVPVSVERMNTLIQFLVHVTERGASA